MKLSPCRRTAWLERVHSGDDGFTLLELLIVVTTIAVLLVISVPSLTGARETARDRAAQSDLRTAYSEAQVSYYDQYSFDTANAAGLRLLDPGIPFDDGGPAIAAVPSKIFISVASGPQWLGVKYSKSGRFYGLTAVAGGGIGRCKTDDIDTAKAWTAASCTGSW